MNFLEIAQYLADQLDDDRPVTIHDADLGLLSRTARRWRDHINLAYNMVLLSLGRKNEYRETTTTLATVSGTETYNIPAGILKIDQLQMSTDPPLRILPWPEYQRYRADTFLITVSGYPDVVSIYQRKIYFYPVPDDVYTINIFGQEIMTDLDEDTDEPDLPDEFHRVIAEFSLYYEMEYEGNPRAGTLIANEQGHLNAQGGQAAKALNMLQLVRKNSRDHMEEPPRIITRREMRRLNALRRIIRA